MTRFIRAEIVKRVAYLTIDRPESHNAVTLDMWEEMARSLATLLARDPAVLVVSGVPGHFAAGADIKEFHATRSTREASRRSFLAVDSLCRSLTEAPVPVIAAIEGYAIGAGLELSCACDIRLASADSRLGITASKLGITVGREHIRRLIGVVGAAHALDLLTTGRLVTAAEAYHMGLVTEVVSPGKLPERLKDWVDRYGQRAPLSLAWAKQAVYGILADPHLDWVRDDAEESIDCFETENFREAVRAFQEHRPPKFRGKGGRL